jgi:hypothetical protein
MMVGNNENNKSVFVKGGPFLLKTDLYPLYIKNGSRFFFLKEVNNRNVYGSEENEKTHWAGSFLNKNEFGSVFIKRNLLLSWIASIMCYSVFFFI